MSKKLLISCALPLDGKEEPGNYLVPIVIRKTPQGERAFDIFSRLLEERIVMLDAPIGPEIAGLVNAQMMFLEAEDPTQPIMLYINSPGGYVSAGLSIIDTMEHLSVPVQTICRGMCASMAAVILAAGDKGGRLAMPHAEVMIHQPLGGASGQQTDIELAADHIKKTRATLEGLLARYTGHDIEKIHLDSERDNYMTAQEALEYGLIDEILVPQGKAPLKNG